MSRKRGSKNSRPFFYSVNRLRAKAEKLRSDIILFEAAARSNQRFRIDHSRFDELKEYLDKLSKSEY